MRGIKNKENGKWKKLAAFVALLFLFGVLLNSVRNIYQKKQAAGEALARMEEEKTKLEERDQFLKDSLNKLATTEGIKFEIRNKLNVAEVGESVAIIVNEEASSSTQTPSISTWQKIKNFFLNLFR
jgi:cell division protein FtsB